MKDQSLAFSSFPFDFRQKAVDQIIKIINRGECCQVVSLPGSGKSLLLSEILPKKLKRHQIFYFNLNLLAEKSTSAVINLILNTLLQKTAQTNPQAAIQGIEDFLKKRKAKSQKTIFIFDDFQCLQDSALEPFFGILKSFHSQNRFSMNYIFAVNREIKNYLAFGPLATRLSENVLFLPPASPKDARWFLKEYEKLLQIKLSDQERKKIIHFSGGYLRTIKRLAQVKSSGQHLNEVFESPTKNTHLINHFEELLKILKPEEKTLKNLIWDKITEVDQENLQTLKKLHLLKASDEFTYPLFFKFLKHKFGQKEKFTETIEGKINLRENLTLNEHRALQFLIKHRAKICSREDLITAIWGKNAFQEVADHALDQLVHRLRKKLSSAQPPVTLRTIRGRGHRLNL